MELQKPSLTRVRGRNSMLYTGWIVLRIVLLVWLGIVAIAYFSQRRIMFPASREIWQTPAVAGWAFEEVNLPVQGKMTNGWFIPSEQARGCVLYAHGNGETIANGLSVIHLFREMGFSVLLFDYGGYGKSSGSPSEKRCEADIRSMWDWLIQQKGITPEHMVVAGRSLGGGVAVDLASKVKPSAVILSSTFSSAATLGQEAFPFLPVWMLIRDPFESDKKISQVKAPVLIAHSPEDEIIPFRHGERLFALAQEPKTFLRIHGGHNDGAFFTDREYVAPIKAFLDQAIP